MKPMPDVVFERLRAGDLFEIERQPSQARVLGAEPGDIDWDTAEVLAGQPVAWAARCEGRLIALFGIGEHHEGRHGVAWSILGEMGAAHLAVTRRIRGELQGSRLARVELIARAAEVPFTFQGDKAVEWVMRPARISPECRWAVMLGFTPAHVLKRYGPDGDTHMLFEWFGPASGRGADHG
ncbi:hypothetical protein [Novosphingobium sp. RL4]|uniref:hypothetical protein n=1 Tax=Novosphingobium sp. RL4 TaxID=3109595 RepID=UPI002D78C082|nr:hypothetical protein [Novosphingobium sp. RL4]WRT91363.1 hypothetical protein U9J33_08975 [Novosphingobium sp. RL4]